MKIIFINDYNYGEFEKGIVHTRARCILASDIDGFSSKIAVSDKKADAADSINPEAACTDHSTLYKLATTTIVNVHVDPGAIPPSLILSDGSRAMYDKHDTDGALLFSRVSAAESDGRLVVVDLDPGTSRFTPGRWAAPSRPAVFAAGGPSASFIVVDLNDTGVADIIGVSPLTRGVIVRSGTVDGSFAPAVFHPTSAHPIALAVTDLTGNGFLDIVVASRRTLSVLLNDNGHFRPAIHFDQLTAMVDETPSLAPMPIRPAQFHELFAAFISALVPHGDLGRAADASLVVAAPALMPAVITDDSAPSPPLNQLVGVNLRSAADQIIERSLHDPAFSPETLRHALGLSRSQLYRIFEDDKGVAAAIRDARLDRMYRRLAVRASRPATKVKTVIVECGFTDAASVSRAFRRRFGLSPRDVRSPRLPPTSPGGKTISS